ncbi:hypothetical protein PFISCL1PPCAC_5991, partial [Pristionchus fissidentatus]
FRMADEEPDDGVDIFLPENGIQISSSQSKQVKIGKCYNGVRIASFTLKIIKTPEERPLSSFAEVNYLTLYWIDGHLYLMHTTTTRRITYWTPYFAVAQIEKHPFFETILVKPSSARNLILHVINLDDDRLEFCVYLPSKMIESDMDSALGKSFSEGCRVDDINTALRQFGLMPDAGYFHCPHHNPCGSTDSCLMHLKRGRNIETAETIQQFFDHVHEEQPVTKKYKLRTESLTSRLRPYQRDAVRFMIDREMHPRLRFHFSWFFYHVKLETDLDPLYYLPNLGIFLDNPPNLSILSTCGGILADEMGLGKTVELLALINTLTPDSTPEIEEGDDEETQEDEVRIVVDEMVSQVVAEIEGEAGVEHFKKHKKEAGIIYYSKSRFMPQSPTKSSFVSCEECGTSCIQQKVHWSPGLSAQTRFVCPECIMTMKEVISVKATLIVVPNSIAHQWYEEIRKHVKEQVKIDVYRGVSVDGYKHPHYLNQFDIVITTYDVITKERNYVDLFCPRRLRKRPYEMAKVACTPLFSVHWWRICLDESQMVDNGASSISVMCKGLRARARWSVTGTPISTSIRDLHGLINFLDLTPLDSIGIFERLLMVPYLNGIDKQHASLIHLMSTIMWRTEKKHIETSLGRITTHLETVTLSPMEERMYSDLLAKSKENVMSVIGRVRETTRLDEINRVSHSKLIAALSKVQLFLLTSLSSAYDMRKHEYCSTNEPDNEWTEKTFTPGNLFKRLLKDKKMVATRGQRDVFMHLNGLAAFSWLSGRHEEALEWYAKVVDLVHAVGPLNESIGQPNAVVFTSKDTDEKKSGENDDERETKDGRIGKPLPCDSMQFVHMYRNVQWLINSYPELAEKNNIDMEVLTPLFHQAWPSYSRIEESMLKEKELEWEEKRGKLRKEISSECHHLKQRLEFLVNRADWLKDEEGKEFAQFQLNIERKVGIRFKNMCVMHKWINYQINRVSSISKVLTKMIDRCLQMTNCDDLEEVASEGRYRMSDIPKILKSPKKNRKGNGLNDEIEPMDVEELGQRQRMKKNDVMKVEKMPEDEKHEIRLEEIMKKELNELYDGCVFCTKDGEFDAQSQESCLLCATQACHQTLLLKSENGTPSRLRMAVIECIEKELTTIVKRRRVGLVWPPAHLKDWEKNTESIGEIESYWRSLLIVVLEKINRIRELRQCTIRSENEMSMEIEKNRLKKAATAMERAIHNLKYVYSLREDSGVSSSSPSSSSSRNSPLRECPICFDEISDAWFVFPCAHINCGSCFNRMIKLQGATRIACSVCRSNFSQSAVLYVSNKRKDALSPIDQLNLPVKLNKVVNMITSILTEKPGEKIIVFTALALGVHALRNVFTRASLSFVHLQGDYHHNSSALSKFRNNFQTRVLVMQYEHGGKGLNLTVANHIIFTDCTDDMGLEKQAIGRCDRIGQKRIVHVYYVVAKDTMDERIYNLTRDSATSGMRSEETWTVGTLADLFTEM